MTRNIYIYDTTLHSSREWPAPPLSPPDMQHIARQLDSLGVDYIEVSAQPSDPGGETALLALQDINLNHARLTAAVRFPEEFQTLEDPAWIQPLLSARTPACTLVVNAKISSAMESLEIEGLWLERVRTVISQIKGLGKEVFLEIEDFFEAYMRDPGSMERLIQIGVEGDSDRVVLNETAGRTLPWEAGKVVHEVFRKFPGVNFGIHFHDAGHSAIAGALTAVDQGVVHVQGSINGFGTRSGEANLCSIVPDLELRMGYTCLPVGKLPGLLDIAQDLMGASSGSTEGPSRYVGRSALNPI